MPKYAIIWLVLLVVSTTACQDELYDRYRNPNGTTTPTVGEFFTGMLNNDRVRPSYWNISTFVNWHVGVYSQSVGYLNGQSMYQQNESYIQNRWDDYYRPGPNGSGVMANFREIEKAFGKLSVTQKEEAEVFVQAAKVVLYDQTSQMVDLWGDIPFSEAGSLNASSSLVYPKFDAAEEIYSTITEDLEKIAAYFGDATLSPSAQTQFAKQDILLFGDIEKWQRYANSLRLRLLMRVSFVDEAKSKEEVMKILHDNAKYPLLDESVYTPGTDDVLLHPLSTYAYDLHDAFLDWTNYPAPHFALESVLKPANDPRIPVLYDKYGETTNGIFTANSEFNAMPLTLSSIEQQENLVHYAILDSATFLFNTKLPGVVFTVSEINFLKAEAYERWGWGDATHEFLSGIKNSIRFYYYLNSLNTTTRNPLTPPVDQEVEDFLSNSSALAYTGTPEQKLGKIGVQKWIHFGFLQSVQGWAEMRRTGYPQLSFSPASRAGYELPPTRLTYPGIEKTYNENYSAVASEDFRDTKVFWHVK